MILRIALAGTVAALAASASTADLSAAPRKPPLKPLVLRETCVTRAERRRVVRFTTFDRVRLIGVELGSGPRVVILAHQGGGGGNDGPALCSWMRYARILVLQGYRVLAFDHRGFGSSGQTSHGPRITRVDFDVLAAIQVMRARGATRIVLAGASLGGSAVLSAAALARPAVDGVISFASPQSFGRIDTLKAAMALRVPVLFISAEEDVPFPEDARAMYDACPSPDKRIAIVPGTVHGAPVLRDPATRALVDGWIRDHL